MHALLQLIYVEVVHDEKLSIKNSYQNLFI